MPNRLASHTANPVFFVSPLISNSHLRAPTVKRLLVFWPRYLLLHTSRTHSRRQISHHVVAGTIPQYEAKGLKKSTARAETGAATGARCARIQNPLAQRSEWLPGRANPSNEAHYGHLGWSPTDRLGNGDENVPQESLENRFDDEQHRNAHVHNYSTAGAGFRETENVEPDRGREDAPVRPRSKNVKVWALRFYEGSCQTPQISNLEALKSKLQNDVRASLSSGNQQDSSASLEPIPGISQNYTEAIPVALQLEWVESLLSSPISRDGAYEAWKSQIQSSPDLWTWSVRECMKQRRPDTFDILDFRRNCEMLISTYHPRVSGLMDMKQFQREFSSGSANHVDREGLILHNETEEGRVRHMQSTENARYTTDVRAPIWIGPFLTIQNRHTQEVSTFPDSAEPENPNEQLIALLASAWNSLYAELRTILWPHILAHFIRHHPESAIAMYRAMRQPQSSQLQGKYSSKDVSPRIPRHVFLHALLVRIVYGRHTPSHAFRTELFNFFQEDMHIFTGQSMVMSRGRLNTIMRCIVSLADDRLIQGLWKRLHGPLQRRMSSVKRDSANAANDQSSELRISRYVRRKENEPASDVSPVLTSHTLLHISYRLALAGNVAAALEAVHLAISLGHSPADKRLGSVINVILRQTVAGENVQSGSVSTTRQILAMGIPLNRTLTNVLILNAVQLGDAETAVGLYNAGLQGGLEPDSYTFDFTLRALRISSFHHSQAEEITQRAIQYAVANRDRHVANAILRCAFGLVKTDARQHSEIEDSGISTKLKEAQHIWETICQLYARMFPKRPLEALGIWPMDNWFVDEDAGVATDFTNLVEEASWEGRVTTDDIDHASSSSETHLLLPDSVTITIMVQIRLMCMDQPPLSMVKALFRRFWSLTRSGSSSFNDWEQQRSTFNDPYVPEIARAAESQHIWNLFIIAAGKSARVPGQDMDAVFLAFEIFQTMLHSAFMRAPGPSQWTFDSLLLVCNRHQAYHACEVIEKMMESRVLKRSQLTWNAIVERHAQLHDSERAALAIENMKEEGYSIGHRALRALRRSAGSRWLPPDDNLGRRTTAEAMVLGAEPPGYGSQPILSDELHNEMLHPENTRYVTKGSFGAVNLGYAVNSTSTIVQPGGRALFDQSKHSEQSSPGIDELFEALKRDIHISYHHNNNRSNEHPRKSEEEVDATITASKAAEAMVDFSYKSSVTKGSGAAVQKSAEPVERQSSLSNVPKGQHLRSVQSHQKTTLLDQALMAELGQPGRAD